MNIELLERIAAAIEAKPELYNQNAWRQRTEYGTACCIAGWAVEIGDPTYAADYDAWSAGAMAYNALLGRLLGRRPGKSLPDRAQELLGLDAATADCLFSDDTELYWPEDYDPQEFDPNERGAAHLLRALAAGRIVFSEDEARLVEL